MNRESASERRARRVASRALPLVAALATIFCGCAEAQNAASSRAAEPAKGAAKSADFRPGVAEEKPLDGNEWPFWRGPEQNGVSRATGLISSWKTPEENLLWKAEAGGRSTPIVMGGRVFVIRPTGHGPAWREEVVALDAHTGKVLWRHDFDLFHTDVPLDRVGWAALCGDPETGNIYAHGVQGTFLCFDRDGKILWERSLTEEFGRISGYGGRTHTPIVDKDLVIISSLFSGLGAFGKGMHRYLAMDKRTGEVRWWATPGGDPEDTTYSVPVVATIAGVRQLIAGNADGGVYGMKVSTGETIWKFDLSKRGINSSVVVGGDKVYVCHSEDNLDSLAMGRVVCIDATGTGDVTKTHEVWRHDAFAAGYSSPVLHEGRLYVADNSSNFVCLDAATGAVKWKEHFGRVAKGSPVLADGKLFYGEDNGTFFIAEPSDAGCKVLSSIEFKNPDGTLIDMKGSPAIAYGRVYFQSRDALYCLGPKDAKTSPISIPPIPDTGAAEGPATHIQAIPGETAVARDGEVAISVWAYDAKGRLLGPAEGAAFELAGLKGSISPQGVFVPDPAINGQFGLVKIKVGELTAESRVRILPSLPIVEDFEKIPDGALPGHWIGATKVKFKVVEEDGNRILRKTADDDRFRRALAYAADWRLKDYTTTVDVRIREQGRNLPDAGLIFSRYQFDLMGNYEQLRLVGWVPMPRVQTLVDFVPDPEVWYTMKSRVDYHDKGATVRGKIWKRGEPEPEAWSIELEDPLPNRNGSPGLASFSQGEIDYDNFRVEAN